MFNHWVVLLVLLIAYMIYVLCIVVQFMLEAENV